MKLFADLPADDGLPGRERRLAMAAVMLGTTMAVLDGSIVNVALPTIAHALHVDAPAAIWVANAYLLATAMLLVSFASLADIVGFRRLYATGLLVFTLASLGCALSGSLDMLVAMRLLQGIGGAAMFSIGPAIYRMVFPTRLLGSALGINALTVAASTAAGPAIGGAMLAVLGWQWLFAINVPLGIVAIALALRAIPQRENQGRSPAGHAAEPVAAHAADLPRRSARFDLAGAVLSATAMGMLIMAADACAQLTLPGNHSRAGWYGVIAVAATFLFIWRQRHAARPLLPLDIFASGRFSMAALTSFCSFVGQGITFIALPFLFQGALGYSALESALLFTPWPLAIVLAAPYAGRLADRHSPAVLSSIGLAVLTLGVALLAALPTHATALDICWRGFVCGLGFGFFQSPNNREMLGNVVRARSGAASGILGIARTFGQSLGAAVVALVLAAYAYRMDTAGTGPASVALQDAAAMHGALWIAAAMTLLATLLSVSRIPRKVAAAV
ncbi:MFS transporter [Robbsia sp. Bb-Pol-6]|uniref:MFS transporter n=1 Tax=Robbsia betulipollinis TaxID=2981849 RepID=A0ABT3ZMR9_9BURK|nr:MFS transporter [Robbsia betulipollinis]MCY0387838.1 MFS transporter [Robbsia betulipollinis]